MTYPFNPPSPKLGPSMTGISCAFKMKKWSNQWEQTIVCNAAWALHKIFYCYMLSLSTHGHSLLRKVERLCVHPASNDPLLIVYFITDNKSGAKYECMHTSVFETAWGCRKRETFFKLIQINIYNWFSWKSGSADVAHLRCDGYDAICFILYFNIYLLEWVFKDTDYNVLSNNGEF